MVGLGWKDTHSGFAIMRWCHIANNVCAVGRRASSDHRNGAAAALWQCSLVSAMAKASASALPSEAGFILMG
jgi:hypothetical protein